MVYCLMLLGSMSTLAKRIVLLCIGSLSALLPLSGCDEHGHSHGDIGEVLTLLPNGDSIRGEMRFEETCARSMCHGSDGASGIGPVLSEVLLTHDDTALAGVIRNGEGRMPPQLTVLSDSAIADVMVYLRGRFPSE